jgi:hypothetical protein
MTWLDRYLTRIQRSGLRWFVVTICSLVIIELGYRCLRHGVSWPEWVIASLCLLNIVLRLWPTSRKESPLL